MIFYRISECFMCITCVYNKLNKYDFFRSLFALLWPYVVFALVNERNVDDDDVMRGVNCC